jgi:ribosomal protein L20A (L18A)
MKAFEISGELMMSLHRWQPFAIQVAAQDEKSALEKTMALMGSRHKVKRKSIKIQNVKSLKLEEVTDNVVKHLLGEKK